MTPRKFKTLKNVATFLEFVHHKICRLNSPMLILGAAVVMNEMQAWRLFVLLTLAYFVFLTALSFTAWLIEGTTEETFLTQMATQMEGKEVPQQVRALIAQSNEAAGNFIEAHKEEFAQQDERLKELKKTGLAEFAALVCWSFTMFPTKNHFPMTGPIWVKMIFGCMLIREASELRKTVEIFAKDYWSRQQVKIVSRVRDAMLCHENVPKSDTPAQAQLP